MHNVNVYLFTLINQGAGYYPLLDGFFIILTSYIASAAVVAVLVYLFIFAYRTGDPFHRVRRFGALVETSLSLFIVWAVASILKVLVAYPRPFVSMPDIKTLVHAAPYQSFPSSHAALTMAVAVAVLPYHKHLGHLLIAFSFVVAMSRIFVGVHYPFDVGVGFLIGFVVPKLVHQVFTAKKIA